MRENTDQFGSPITVKTVSLNGVGAISEQKLLTEKTYKMKINIGEEQQIEILVTPVWSGRDHTYGFSIRSQSTEWTHFVNTLENTEKKSA